MDYSLLLGIHDINLAEAGDDVDDFLGGLESNEDSDLESPREGDSPQESDSPGEGDMSLTDTPPTTPPAHFNGARERNISFGSAELDEREEEDATEVFQSVDGMFNMFLMLNRVCIGHEMHGKSWNFSRSDFTSCQNKVFTSCSFTYSFYKRGWEEGQRCPV